MELVTNTNILSFDCIERKNALSETKKLSKSIKKLRNSVNLKADSLISKKKLKKTKIKIQEKTKESLVFNSNASNSNANSNENNYCDNHDLNNLNNLIKQDEQICLNSDELIIFDENLRQKDTNLNELSSISSHKMTVNSLQMSQNIKTPKLRKSKKIKKKKTEKSQNSKESIFNNQNQNDKNNKKEVDFNILQNNESIRWENELIDKKDEAERIELYKINRRKRYIEQKNKILKIKLKNDLACDSSLSSSSTCSVENIDSKNFQKNLENIEVDKLNIITTDQQDKEANALVQDSHKSSSVCLIVKREKETDSAISSISSNSQMFS